jgi:L,D-peptidoglycan transpeptidase YkuD (ErfK/YbiS/YcfS/YnhG family)
MSTHRYAVGLAAAAALGIAPLAACGAGDQGRAAATSPSLSLRTSPTTTARSLTTTSAAPSTTRTTATRSTVPRPTATAVKSTATATKAPVPAPKPPPANLCRVPAGVTAEQVVLVDSAGAGATVRACRRTAGGYRTELGPYDGHVGRNGVSAAKREGDLRTPAGVFPLRGGFGAYANPGLRLGSWLQVDAQDVWVDDSASSLYNTHQRTPVNGRWASAEKLLNQPAYNYAQVIGYNEARTPGRGSAIFLHVDKGAGTAGCVSLPTGPLLAVLRWERAGAVIAIR